MTGADRRAAPTLLGIFAHPDDESLACGGLFARCAALGVQVVVVSLTRGEAGPTSSNDAETATRLGDVRTAEFQAAARVLGATDAVVRSHADGMLAWIEPSVLDADLQALLDAYQPQVVVTFDADGLYWHPDHIAVHQRTTAAVTALGAAAPALYYVSMPRGQMRAVTVRAGRSTPVVPGLDDPDVFGADAPAPTLAVDAGPLAVRKLAAILCHASQFGASAFAALSADDAALIAIEHYRRAPVGAVGPTFIDRLGAAPALVS
jgi:LmbE family N-acetylglucosaminyl deacetylase